MGQIAGKIAFPVDIYFRSTNKHGRTLKYGLAVTGGVIASRVVSGAIAAEDGLYGFASAHAGEYFLGSGFLIATVQTLNISQQISGTFLGGKVALRLVKALRHWAKTRNCEHLIAHVTNGVSVTESDQFFRRCGMKTVGGIYFGEEM